MSSFLQFLRRHPKYALNRLSLHHALTPELLRRHTDKLNWYYVGCNDSIPWTGELIDKFSELLMEDGEPETVWSNESVPWSVPLLEKYCDKVDWLAIVQNVGAMRHIEIRERFAEELAPYMMYYNPLVNPEKMLDVDTGMEKTGIEYFLMPEDELVTIDWDWHNASRSESFPWDAELIERYKDKWVWRVLSDNPAVPWNAELINKYKHRIEWGRGEYNEDGIVSLGVGGISFNQGIRWTIELIKEFEEEIGFQSLALSQRAEWSLEMLEAFEHRWPYDELFHNNECWQKVFGHLSDAEVLEALDGFEW